jgi:hypothetical protein
MPIQQGAKTMSNEPTIMLAKNYDEENMAFPCYVSEKLDGVPVRIALGEDGKPFAQSRQGKVVHSIQHILDALAPVLAAHKKWAVVGELYITGKAFEYINGKVRKQENCPELCLNLYDTVQGYAHHDFQTRYGMMQDVALAAKSPCVQAIPMLHCANKAELASNMAVIQQQSQAQELEGFMVRIAQGEESLYYYGRSWGMMRIVPKPTLDLRVVDVLEAHNASRTALGRVGSFLVAYKGEIVKVGAGKGKKSDLEVWWQNKNAIVGRIIQVQYKPSSYAALRQPTFQRVRYDKRRADA